MEVALADAVVVEACQEHVVPKGWVWTRVCNVGDVQLGRQRAPQHHNGEHMRPYLRVANVFEDRIDTSDVLHMNFTPEEYQVYKLQYGDILLNEGQSLELVGRAAMYRNEVPGACFQNTLIRFRAFDCVLPKYALWVFIAYLHTGKFRRIAKWTTNIAHLGAKRFAGLEFPLAPLAEQRRIVAEIEAQFTRLDAGVAALQRVQRALQRYRAGVLKAACEGRLVPQDPGDEPAGVLLQRILAARRARWEANELAKMKARGKTPKDDAWKRRYTEPAPPDTAGLPALPEGWCWAKLEQLITRIEAGHSPKAQGRPALPGEYGVVKVSAMSWGSFLPEENKALFPGHVPDDPLTIRAGDLLISRANTVELVGAVVLVERDHPNLMLSDKSLRIIPASDEVSPKWLLYVLRAPTVRHFFESVATGTSDSMRNLSQEKIRAAPIALPPLSEQHRIIAEVERRLSVVAEVEATVEANLKRAERLRQSILKRAFEGRLVPQDPNDEPAGELLARVRAQRRIRAAQLRFSGL